MRQCSVSFFFNSLCLREKIGTHLRSLSRKGWDCPRLQISQGKPGQLCRRWSEMGCMWHALDKRLALESWREVAWFELDLWINAKRGQLSFEVWTFAEGNIRKQSLGMGQILKSSDSDQSHVQCACLIVRVTFWCHRFEVLWSAPACGLIPRSKSGITLKIQLLLSESKYFKPMSLKVRVLWNKRFDC
jgi:hypothetical protein